MQDRNRLLLELLDSHGRQLHALLARLTLRQDVAEELMQDLFVNLSRSQGFGAAENPASYACRAAINLALSWRRTRRETADIRRTTALEWIDPPADASDNPLTRLAADEQVQRVLDALPVLPELYREVIVRRFLQQEDYASIAESCHRTPQQLRSVCHKALRLLRRALGVAHRREQEESPCVP